MYRATRFLLASHGFATSGVNSVRHFGSATGNSLVNYSKNGSVAVIGMDDGKMNSFSFQMMKELQDALDKVENDKETTAVVIHGNEKCFSAGFDLSVMMGKDKDAVAEMITQGCNFGLRLFEHKLPIVIGCTGHALAMGAITLLASDLRIGPSAGTKAKIGLNEIAINVSPPIFMTEMARAKMSPQMLNKNILHALVHSPEKAMGEAGFLDELVDEDSKESVIECAIRRAQELGDIVQQPAFHEAKLLMRKEARELVKRTLAEDMDRYRK
mmetsp:Transcript_12668/g.16389  ORF Transcript_12668/g.16389 Transcript_12668/m.16389 type:complete len:270 (-) Transcript_12668:800-1609(-)